MESEKEEKQLFAPNVLKNTILKGLKGLILIINVLSLNQSICTTWNNLPWKKKLRTLKVDLPAQDVPLIVRGLIMFYFCFSLTHW